jgi:hypothetical protein
MEYYLNKGDKGIDVFDNSIVTIIDRTTNTANTLTMYVVTNEKGETYEVPYSDIKPLKNEKL